MNKIEKKEQSCIFFVANLAEQVSLLKKTDGPTEATRIRIKVFAAEAICMIEALLNDAGVEL